VEAWDSEVLAPLRVLLADPGFHAVEELGGAVPVTD